MQIINFSPIRTGSTLVYNILKELGYNCQKTHRYYYNVDCYYIITIRHPYNSIISTCLSLDLELNSKNITETIDTYIKNGGQDILDNNFNKPKHAVLYYERFFKNNEEIYNVIEKLFEKKHNIEDKEKINKKFSLENIKKTISQFKNFSDYDKDTHLHGNHISIYNGETDYIKILSEEQIKILEKNKILSMIVTKYYNF
jgi:hypothetical protein